MLFRVRFDLVLQKYENSMNNGAAKQGTLGHTANVHGKFTEISYHLPSAKRQQWTITKKV